MFTGNLEIFHGLSVMDFNSSGDIANFATTAPRIRCEYDGDHELSDLLGMLLDEPGIQQVRALVFGVWMEGGEATEVSPRPAIELLVANKAKLPNLEAIFFGDIVSEENEISWITNGDFSPVWAAFPRLVEFGTRGGNDLRLGKIRHAALKKLVIETGGLPAGVAREALDSDAPIKHLELWFGVEGHGLSTTIRDLEPLFSGNLFPNLKTLALRNCDFADEIAERLTRSPLLDRIEELDLSMGTLQDRGALALAGSGRLDHLKRLEITHHYVSADALKTLAAATPNLIADEALKPDTWDGELHYYVSVAE
jgi:hypothetical protein